MNNDAMPADEFITLGQAWRAARTVRWYLLAGSVGGAAIALAISFAVRPVYQARVTVLPADMSEAGGLRELTSQVGGLAALAGINLGSDEAKTKAIEQLKSRSLVERFVVSQQLMPELFAHKWDATQGKWRVADARDVPTLAKGVRKFQEDVRNISEDRRTGVVTVSIEWFDPQVAQRWANEFIHMANNEVRSRAIREAQAIRTYLDQQIEKTPVMGVREALYRVAETQLKTEALAKVREDYAFQVIDPAYLPDEEDIVWPRRALLVVTGALLGAILLGGIRLASMSRP